MQSGRGRTAGRLLKARELDKFISVNVNFDFDLSWVVLPSSAGDAGESGGLRLPVDEVRSETLEPLGLVYKSHYSQ